MSSLQELWAFVVFSAAAAGTPGPSNVMLTVTGALAGVVRGLRCLAGVVVGMGLMMFSAAVGIGALVTSAPVLLLVFKWTGAAYLGWLAWRIATAPVGNVKEGGEAVGFWAAFAFQWLNPKSWLVSVSATGSFVQMNGSVLGQALLIGIVFAMVATVCGFIWLCFGVTVRQALRSPRLHRAFNVAMASLLALSVLLFLK